MPRAFRVAPAGTALALALGLALVAWGLSARGPGPATTAKAAPHARPAGPAPPAAAATPARLLIPGIGVDAPIEQVGLTSNGDLATPADVRGVGLYRGSSLPGRPGSAVVDGHLDWYGGPAVFAELGRLRPGDPLQVTYDDGSVAAFRVASLATRPASGRPPAELFRRTGPPQLVLLTCAGPWQGAGYRDRLVVIAAPTDAAPTATPTGAVAPGGSRSPAPP
jgi:sortase (surface protein transpeptidase)